MYKAINRLCLLIIILLTIIKYCVVFTTNNNFVRSNNHDNQLWQLMFTYKYGQIDAVVNNSLPKKCHKVSKTDNTK